MLRSRRCPLSREAALFAFAAVSWPASRRPGRSGSRRASASFSAGRSHGWLVSRIARVRAQSASSAGPRILLEEREPDLAERDGKRQPPLHRDQVAVATQRTDARIAAKRSGPSKRVTSRRLPREASEPRVAQRRSSAGSASSSFCAISASVIPLCASASKRVASLAVFTGRMREACWAGGSKSGRCS